MPLLALVGCGDDDDDGESGSAPSPSASPDAANTPDASTGSGEYFPPTDGEWERITPEEAGFTSSGIQNLVDVVRQNRSSTLMLLSGGRVVTENYFGQANETTTADVASVQKSIISTLIGIAIEKGLLNLDDTISDYLPAGWSNADENHEAAITIEHVMTHSSGLHPRAMQSVAAPGTEFDYNTAAYQRLRPVLERASGEEINEISRGWIFDKVGPAGATSWAPRTDEDDAAWGLSMNARDMARFGLLALRRGQWAGAPVVSAGWFDEAWTSSSVNDDYGLLWWLMGKGKVRGPGVPEDWVAALGARDQKIYVFPSFDVVLTRQGLAANEETENVSNFDKVLLNAIADARA